MDNRNIALKHCIIGGTIKAATSAIFTYLSVHPEVCGSTVKETFFFTRDYTGNSGRDLKSYMRYFVPQNDARIALEASPNYLAYKENIAPRIKTLLPDVKLLFILRDPVERLYSYYNFAVGKLELPESLAFEDYLDLCEQYASARLTLEDAGIAEKHLRALEIGEYGKFLQNYLDVFDVRQIKVAFYDDLKRDPAGFMADVCRFAGVDPGFYQDYTFNKVNVTFSARMKPLHCIALLLNRILESVLRQRPGLKMRLVRIYKRLNQGREGYVAMSDATRARLVEYYSQSNKELAELLNGQPLPVWLNENSVGL